MRQALIGSLLILALSVGSGAIRCSDDLILIPNPKGEAWAADVFYNGARLDASRVDITSGATPTPQPNATPTPTPTVQPGQCPAGYVKLDAPLGFANNTWGLDGVDVPIGKTLHFCALLNVPVQVVKFRTADRTGAAQCSNVRLTVSPPDGREPLRSQAVNNTLNVWGTQAPAYLAPQGAYLIDLFGGQPNFGCQQQFVMVYYQR